MTLISPSGSTAVAFAITPLFAYTFADTEESGEQTDARRFVLVQRLDLCIGLKMARLLPHIGAMQ